MEEAKNQRRAAKGKFTRKLNEVNKSIDGNTGAEIVRRHYEELIEAWRLVEVKHDTYTTFLDDREMESSNAWIEDLQEKFSDVMKRQIIYEKERQSTENNERQEKARVQEIRREQDLARRAIEQAFTRRRSAEAIFEQVLEDVNSSPPAILNKAKDQLEIAFHDCKQANDECMSLLAQENANVEISWIVALQKLYNKATIDIESRIAQETSIQETARTNNLRLEKIKMPRFEGELREYPRFKVDFQKQVMPSLSAETASYTLRSCLGKEPLSVVKSVDDNLEEMWRRLDERYGDPAKTVDAIIDSIRKVRPIRDGENKRLIEFIDIIEDGYRDLKRLGLEVEITTTSSVSIIGTIATVALRKTAEMGSEKFPQAAKTIMNNTYMDDIVDSVPNQKAAKTLAKDIEKMLEKGRFKIKYWTFSDEYSQHDDTQVLPADQNSLKTEKILGVEWSPVKDQFYFNVHLNFSPKKRKLRTEPDLRLDQIPKNIPEPLTKRAILSQVNGIYDPLGLAGPFTVRAKIMMRHLWLVEPKLDWDDPIPDKLRTDWIEFFRDLFAMENVVFKRCLKPVNAEGQPSLVVFSDGSQDAYGACAYARWKTPENNGFDSNLIMSKNHLTPVQKMSIDRIELCGAVLNKRLKTFIEKESRYKFAEFHHIVDSQIVQTMVQKESYGFNTFAGTRIGEIRDKTNPADWYWIDGELNIADWLTRGKAPNEIGPESMWQKGPDFLKLPVNEWPVSQMITTKALPETVKPVMITESNQIDSLATRIDINRYSSYLKLLRVTARVLVMYQRNADEKISFKSIAKVLSPEDIQRAEQFWIRDAQVYLKQNINDKSLKRLCPKTNENGIIVVGGRVERWVQMSYNEKEVVLLPYKHRISRLYAMYIHNQGHYGIATTVAKVRSRFWIIGLHRLAKTIKFHCVTCKKLDRKTAEQVMGKLPEERLKPAPAWSSTGIDLFGPFKIKDEIKKRSTGKAYGVLFNCLGTRAVHVDLAPDYSTQKFLLVLRRFVALRGYPRQLISDQGTQLVAANEELKRITKEWDWEKLAEFGVTEGMRWKFVPADAPWQNGITEALIKSVKKALMVAIGDKVMTYSELQTVCFEAANLANERPIGRHPTLPEEGTYLCPKDLLLGRSSSRVPSGPFKETKDERYRFEFVQSVVNSFWKKWTNSFFPSLLTRQKWHSSKRNLQVGDVVLIQDTNLIRGNWKLGKVSRVYPDNEGKVDVQYKLMKPEKSVRHYTGQDYTTVQRAVQRLVVLVPADEEQEKKEN